MRLTAAELHSPNSTFSGFDPRAKVIGTLGFVIGAALLTDLLLLWVAIVFILSLLAVSRVPGSIILKQYGIALPFIIFASASLYFTNAPEPAFAMFLRISASVLALGLLAATTSFFDLLWGLQKLRLPGIMVTLLMFTYRYIFLFGDELGRMKQARRAKHFRTSGSMLDKSTMKVISNTIGMVLVRAYDRGNDIHDALRARGFDGQLKTLKDPRLRVPDYGLCASFLFFAALLVYAQWMVVG